MHVTESIHKVAERVVKLVSMELPDNVKLIRDYDPSLPELPHDPDQIEQVLLNIVRNALQALGPEGAKYSSHPHRFPADAARVRYRLAARIDVEDNGPGIPPHLRIRCSIRWSAAAKAVPAAYLSPVALSISTPAKLNSPAGRVIPNFRYTCLFGSRGVYATRDSGSLMTIAPSAGCLNARSPEPA